MQDRSIVFREQTKIKNDLKTLLPATCALSNSSVSIESALSYRCFDQEIPPFIELLLNQVYGSLYSSMPYFRIHGGLEGASTFVMESNQHTAAIFFFRQEGQHVQVLNEGMPVDETALTFFADYIFDRFKDVDMISFNAVENTAKELRFPYHQFVCTNDSVIDLPETPEAYLNALGKSTRKNIKQNLNRIHRDYPSFNYRIVDGKEIDETYIRGIIEFNRTRFANKNKISAIDFKEEERIVQMVRECGMVGVATIDGKLCAGSITYCLGDHYHSRLRTYDPAFDDYRLGLVCGYLMISECIRLGGKQFHFMSGNEPQKALLKGQHRDQVHMSVFRSKVAALRYADVLFKYTCQNAIREAKLRLLAMEKEESKVPQTLRVTLTSLRKIKTFLSRHT